MVVFSCNGCAEALKKNQVDKHFAVQCRNVASVSCVDCGKDFWGEDFRSHIKCVTEQEKYAGIVPANKGEAKQNAYLDCVRAELGKLECGDSRVKDLVNKCIECDNLPRKQAKFVNFVKSSFHERNPNAIHAAWGILQNAHFKSKASDVDNDKPTPDISIESTEILNGTGSPKKRLHSGEETDKVKKKKKQKREGDRVDEVVSGSTESCGIEEIRIKKKRNKSKLKYETEEMEMKEVTISDEKISKKKKKDKSENREDSLEVIDNIGECGTGIKEDAPLAGKFNWHKTIRLLLKSADDQTLPLKKLRKRVLAEYLATGSDVGRVGSEVELWALFEKKLHSYPKAKVLKNCVQYVK